jgi:hypothetical protein
MFGTWCCSLFRVLRLSRGGEAWSGLAPIKLSGGQFEMPNALSVRIAQGEANEVSSGLFKALRTNRGAGSEAPVACGRFGRCPIFDWASLHGRHFKNNLLLGPICKKLLLTGSVRSVQNQPPLLRSTHVQISFILILQAPKIPIIHFTAKQFAVQTRNVDKSRCEPSFIKMAGNLQVRAGFGGLLKS